MSNLSATNPDDMKKNNIFALSALCMLLMALACSCAPGQGEAKKAGGAAEPGESPSADAGRDMEAAGEEPYSVFFSDSAGHFSIVLDPDIGFVGIDSQGERLYQVFLYDNGPDYPSDGYFRIVKNGRIGYADEETGAVQIKPQYTAAYPFVNGYAPICPDCVTEKDGEYSRWGNGKWGLIDKQGRVVLRPEYEEVLEVGKDGQVLVAVNGGQKWVRIE